MKDDAFLSWMKCQGTMGRRPMLDAVSRCRRIERDLKIDLDNEYLKDGGRYLVSLLEYSMDDENLHKPAPEGIHFQTGANIKNSLASLKAAIRKYFEFCRSVNY